MKEYQKRYRSKPNVKARQAELMREKRGSMSSDEKAEYLANRRATRLPLTDLQKAQYKIRALEWREQRIKDGFCVSCKEIAAPGLIKCVYHWFHMIATAHKMSARDVPMLQKLWSDQSGMCALTGEPLIMGGGASLDHKLPTSRGGTNAPENLQWVLMRANLFQVSNDC